MNQQTVDWGREKRSIAAAIWKGTKGKCPSCGKAPLFDNWLKVTPQCQICDEELHHERAQDFPPYITISIVGHIIVTLVLVVEANTNWSMVTHMLIWLPLTILLSLVLMQPVKGGVVGLQWALRMFGFGGESDDG